MLYDLLTMRREEIVELFIDLHNQKTELERRVSELEGQNHNLRVMSTHA